MLKFIKGDMLKARAEALVNTVNTVGVMGKGIALQFKEAFPQNNKAYIEACKNEVLAPGKLLAVWDSNLLLGKKLIINFPTKTHWRHPSKYEYIEKGLIALVGLLKEKDIKSVALPPLGCGNGGLDWSIVKPMMIDHLSNLPIDISIFEPNAAIKEVLRKENAKKDAKLTPSRAQLIYALFAYESFGENSSLFAANKLAYFLQRMGQPMKLHFKPNNFGPFALGVGKVLYAMNGVYLNGLEQQEAKPFDPLNLNYEKWQEVKDYVDKNMNSDEKQRLDNLIKLITGFTSELSLEILSTIAYILDENPNYTLENVLSAIKKWSDRKEKLFKDEYVKVAYSHLKEYEIDLHVA